MIDDDDDPAVRLTVQGRREIVLRFHTLTRGFPEDATDPLRDLVVTASGESVTVEVTVRTLGGDGLDVFLAGLAEDFRGWTGARTWSSLEGELTLSAVHTGATVRLTWGVRDGFPGSGWESDWEFTATTAHAPGEEMRDLAAGMRWFLESEPTA